MRKALLLLLLVCLLPSCRGGREGAARRVSEAFAEGELQLAEGRFDAAFIAFTQAMESAERLGEAAQLAKCLYALGETYNRAYFYDEGFVYADSAWHLSLRANMPTLADSALYQMALSQIGLEQYAEATRLFDRLLEEDLLPAEQDGSGLACQARRLSASAQAGSIASSRETPSISAQASSIAGRRRLPPAMRL